MPSAARIGDQHQCPALGAGNVVHLGGALSGGGAPTVLIEGMPAARIGDAASCIGAQATIIGGSTSVLIAGMPAARSGDSTSHGGQIITGASTVQIGD
ncbi:MAG: PAAR domain-containing protein [Pseudoxanthomonas sp.]